MKYPQIRFRDSELLIGAIYSDVEASYMPPITKTDERDKLRTEVVSARLSEYANAWQPYGSKLVQGMCDLLDLEFNHNIIDVYAAPFYHAISFPVFIATKYEPDRAVEVIVHELLHVLLYDNTTSDLSMIDYNKKWGSMFPGAGEWETIYHIPVHAMLQALFDDILNAPERTARDKEMCSNHPTYNAAWDYVDKVGYKTIIDQLRESYKKLGEQQKV